MILQILLLLLFLGIFIGLLVWVPWRLRDLFGIEKKRYVFAPVILATVLAIVFLMLLNFTSNLLVFIVYRILSVWVGVFFYLICFLAIFELVNGIVILFKNERIPKKIRIPEYISMPKRTAGMIVILLTILTSTYGVINAYEIEVERVDIEVDNLNGTVDIAVLADVHIGSVGGKGYLEMLVEKTNSLEPDIVLILGDIVDSDAFLTEDMFSPLKDLEAPAYFVTGNHEIMMDEKELKNILNRSGVRVMDNEVIETHGIQLVGLRYMSADDHSGEDSFADQGDETIKSVLPTFNLSDDSPVVLMHHSPVGITYAQEAGIDLYLAGHTHGGAQIFPLTVLVGPLTYDYYKDHHRYKDMDVYVSEGAGFWFLPMRVGTDTEITLIRLRGDQ